MTANSTRIRADIGLSLIAAVAAAFCSHRCHALPITSGAHNLAATSFVYPVMGPRTSSSFGVRQHPVFRKTRRHHDGIDLAAPTGAIIRSIASGYVIYADRFGGYGNLIVVKHANGLTSHYGHCNQTLVEVGQKILAGGVIGTVGSTGLSTGPHLHFEIRRDGHPQHPETYLPGLATPAQG
jgi:murein DD-endopeptidase MepM/ murein hydrolase activator NlpD